MAYGMVIDLKKCVNCRGCALACKEANGTPRGDLRARVERTLVGTYPDVRAEITPMLCMQCANPACVEVCPVGATWKDNETGIVFVDKETCIGCQSCKNACPYGARYLIGDPAEGYFENYVEYEDYMYSALMPAGKIDKCDFCAKKVALGEMPACVSVCMAKARIFGDLDELRAQYVDAYDGFQLLADQGTEPSVWYLPVDHKPLED